MRKSSRRIASLMISLCMMSSGLLQPLALHANEQEEVTVQEFAQQSEEYSEDYQAENAQEAPAPEEGTEELADTESEATTESTEETVDEMSEEAEYSVEAEPQENMDLQAAGDEDVNPISAEDEATPAKKHIILDTEEEQPDVYIFADEKVLMKQTEEELRLILNGLSPVNKDKMIEAIREYYKAPLEDATGIYSYLEFENINFIDAEKWSVDPYVEYDRNLCWAAAASNAIWASGWGEDVINPLTKQKFASADEILTYFATYFEDKPGNELYGLQWFWDAIYLPERMDDWSHLTKEDEKYARLNGYGDGESQAGLLKEYCADLFVDYAKLSNDDRQNMLDVADKLKDSAVGITVNFADPDGESVGGHALTLMGVIVDETKDGLDKYVALLVADSDNNPVNRDIFPLNIEQATTVKSQQPNIYALYYLDQYTDGRGNEFWTLRDYAPGLTTTLSECISLKKVPYVDIEDVTETEGTQDVLTTPDLFLNRVMMLNNNQEAVESYKEGEDVTVYWEIRNQSQVTMTPETAKAEILTHQIEIYKDGKLCKSINVTSDLTQQQNQLQSYSVGGFIDDLSEYYRFTPGNYTVKFYMNIAGKDGKKVSEAYYLNNLVQEVSFNIIKATDPVNPVNPQEDKKNKYESEETNRIFIQAVFVNSQDEKDVRFGIYDKTIEGIFYLDVNVEKSLLNHVYCDGEKIDPAHYEVKEISDHNFRIIIENEFMNGLEKGEHQFDVELACLAMPYPVKVQVME